MKPSHVVHDLELADLGLSLLPRKKEEYQPKVKGKPAGPAVAIEVPYLPRQWRWYHSSVFRRLTVLEGEKDEYDRFVEKPAVAVAFDPDAILETDAYNCTRYFIEWDRGTEPVAGAKETRTILDKLKRVHRYFWNSHGPGGWHWTQARSYYLDAFKGAEMRRPKVLIITRSAKRADNIHALASQFFYQADPLKYGRDDRALSDFFEVGTVEEMRAKLRKVVAWAESKPKPAEMPWVTELRRVAEAAAREVAERKAREAKAARAAEVERERRHLEAEAEDMRRGREEFEARQKELERHQGVLGKLKGLVVGKL